MNLIDLTEHAAAGRGFSILGLELATNTEGGLVQIAAGGTDDLFDWRRDSDVDLEDWPGEGPGRVHRGFYEASLVVYRFVSRAVQGADAIHLAGHSLGGAFMCLVALMLVEDGHRVELVETYGSPRVGDKEFCQAYPLKIRRYVCGRDPVPSLPWWGYADLGPPILLPSPQGWWRYLPGRRWLDHRLSCYRRALRQKVSTHGTLE